MIEEFRRPSSEQTRFMQEIVYLHIATELSEGDRGSL
jgi:hypothetical protein